MDVDARDGTGMEIILLSSLNYSVYAAGPRHLSHTIVFDIGCQVNNAGPSLPLCLVLIYLTALALFLCVCVRLSHLRVVQGVNRSIIDTTEVLLIPHPTP